MELDLTVLASAAATTLVGVMAADSWDGFKSALVSLWRRIYPERADTVDADLAEARQAVLAARAVGDEQAGLDTAGEWHSRLLRLVATDPMAAGELGRLVEEFQPVVARDEAARVSNVRMTAKASGQGRVFQAGRDQKITER